MMRNVVGLLFLSLTAMLTAACHHHATGPDALVEVPLPPGTVLVLPPRNVIQDGKPHRAGADSGARFAHSLAQAFSERKEVRDAPWHIILATPDARFTNTTVPSAEAAVAEARKVNADYVLRTVLGEFRDAAPMTFRRDFVTLESAHLWRTKNAALVWSLEKPLEASQGNLGHYYPLLDELAGAVAKKIGKTEVARGALEAPPQTAIDPLKGALTTLPALGCTTDQILSMKNSGMSDDQVRRACEDQ